MHKRNSLRGRLIWLTGLQRGLVHGLRSTIQYHSGMNMWPRKLCAWWQARKREGDWTRHKEHTPKAWLCDLLFHQTPPPPGSSAANSSLDNPLMKPVPSQSNQLSLAPPTGHTLSRKRCSLIKLHLPEMFITGKSWCSEQCIQYFFYSPFKTK